MGSHRYCRHPGCDRGLDEPTAREDLIDGQFCVHGHRAPQFMRLQEWVADIDQRLRELETPKGDYEGP